MAGQLRAEDGLPLGGLKGHLLKVAAADLASGPAVFFGGNVRVEEDLARRLHLRQYVAARAEEAEEDVLQVFGLSKSSVGETSESST